MNAFTKKISFYVLFIFFLTPYINFTQDSVGEKKVESGVWKGKVTEYISGEVGIKLK